MKRWDLLGVFLCLSDVWVLCWISTFPSQTGPLGTLASPNVAITLARQFSVITAFAFQRGQIDFSSADRFPSHNWASNYCIVSLQKDTFPPRVSVKASQLLIT